MNTWSEVEKVQPIVAKIIQNSILKNRVTHAYMIQGAKGTGKEAIAMLLAKTLFCENLNGAEPCLMCHACKRIESHNHPDVHIVEPDGQSIKIEQIRNLQKEFTYSGLESKQKVYIIKGSETLTVNAANRILKFLEEPSQQTTAMMLTENSQSMLPTIRSRCQLIDLQPLPLPVFQKQLVDQGVTVSQARLVSTLTNNLEEAIELSNDSVFAESRKLVLQLAGMLSQSEQDAYLFIHQQWMPAFKERQGQIRALDLVLRVFQDIMYYHIDDLDRLVLLDKTDQRLSDMALCFSKEALLENIQAVMHAKQQIKQNVQPTLVMERLVLQVKR